MCINTSITPAAIILTIAITLVMSLIVGCHDRAAPNAPTNAQCPTIPELEGMPCSVVGNTWIYTDEPETMARSVTEVQTATRLYKQYFGSLPQPGALIFKLGLSPQAPQQLERAGATWILPMASPTLLRQKFRESMTKALQAQGAEASEEVIEAKLAQLEKRSDGLAIVPHELGHVWLSAHFDPRPLANPEPEPGHRYGSNLPDWLDEAAALLMETGTIAARRRQGVVETLRSGQFLPLAKLFTAEHPALGMAALAAAQAQAEAGNKVGTVIVATGADDKAATFYQQSISVASYLIERTGNQQIMAVIARAHRDGQSMETWLADQGQVYGLASSIPELDAAWVAWAKSNYSS